MLLNNFSHWPNGYHCKSQVMMIVLTVEAVLLTNHADAQLKNFAYTGKAKEDKVLNGANACFLPHIFTRVL